MDDIVAALRTERHAHMARRLHRRSSMHARDKPFPAGDHRLAFSLVRGGPWFRAEQRLRFEAIERRIGATVTRLVVGLVVGWVPLFLLAWLNGPHEPGGLTTFFEDRPGNAQTFFGIPILLAAEVYIDGRIAAAARRPLLMDLLNQADRLRYLQALATAERQRDSGWVHLLFLVVAFGLSLAQHFAGFGRPIPFSPAHQPLTPVGAWYFVVSLPLFWMLTLLWLWRFLIWAEVIARLGRLDLKVVPTHADRCGGMAYLAVTQASFSVVVFGVGAVITALSRPEDSSSFTGDLLSAAAPQAIYAALSFVVLNLPLLALAPKLLEAKRHSDERFAVLMAKEGRDFEERWFSPARLRRGGSPLGKQDFSSQIDLSSSFEIAWQMRWVPWAFRPTLAIVGAALLSLVPRLLMNRQLLDVLSHLLPGPL